MTVKKTIFLLILAICISNTVVFSQIVDTISIETIQKKLPFGLVENIPIIKPKVAIALSGGGARGLSQIGTLKALSDYNIPLDYIVGTSMGSIVGGLYSAGYSLHQLDSLVINTNWDQLLASDRQTNRRELFVDQKVNEDKAVFSLRLKGLTPVLPSSINNGQKITNQINLFVFQAPFHVQNSFDNLFYKFRAVCTNLVNGDPVVIDKGSLSLALRASASVSFLLPPVQYDSLTLVDGGLVANIPVKIANSYKPDYTIAVNTTSSLHTKNDLEYPWIVADQVVSIPMKLLNENQIKYANSVIVPSLKNHASDDFSNLDSLIYYGYKTSIPEAKKIKESIDSIVCKKYGKKEFYLKTILPDSLNPKIETKLIDKYATKDSISSYEILKDLYNLYLSGNYKVIKAVITRFKNYSYLKIIKEENFLIKNIQINGINIISKDKIDSIITPLINKPYNAKLLEAKILEIINIYRSNGYSFADVYNSKVDSVTGNIIIDFDEGLISKIEIEGNKETNPNIILREIPLEAGEYFKYDKVRQGLINLRSTNLFDDIILMVKRKDHENILKINVSERLSSLMRIGFKVDNVNKAQLSIDVRDENILGSGTEFGVLLFGGTRNRAFELEHKSNRIFDTYLTYKINAFYKFDDVFTYENVPTKSDKNFSRSESGEYREIYYGGSLLIGTQVERFGDLIFKGIYQIEQVKNKINEIEAPYRIKIVSLKVNSTIDTQDKYPYPEKGFYFSGFYETAQKILGGDLGYSNIGFDYKSFWTFANSNTISPRVQMGFADKTLPLSEQYSIGGQYSFFGMHANEYRGRQIFLASLEYRYKFPFKIFFNTYFKFRYDLGYAWPEQEEIRFKDLRHGIGATLSFDTPIGPAEFAVGKSFLIKKNLPGNPLSFGDTLFYFSIGYYY